MARKYAQIQVSIWSDEDFKALDPLYQHMYFVLLSQPRMNLCGVIDFIPARIAQTSYDLTRAQVEERVAHLDKKRYIVVDTDTSELLIRTFIRNDGLMKMPNVATGMASDYGEVMSAKLRTAIEKELARVYADDPDLKGWEYVQRANPVLFTNISKKGSR